MLKNQKSFSRNCLQFLNYYLHKSNFFSPTLNPNEEVPERCTEKLVDLVFVLATKLDLNVNDMRETLESTIKEHLCKFETSNNKIDDNHQSLLKEIEDLKNENNLQNEKIIKLSQNHEIATKNFNELLSDFSKLNGNYQATVVQNHGQRILGT